jgi:hypothetical protein
MSCVVLCRSLWRADRSSSGVLPCVCMCVIMKAQYRGQGSSICCSAIGKNRFIKTSSNRHKHFKFQTGLCLIPARTSVTNKIAELRSTYGHDLWSNICIFKLLLNLLKWIWMQNITGNPPFEEHLKRYKILITPHCWLHAIPACRTSCRIARRYRLASESTIIQPYNYR